MGISCRIQGAGTEQRWNSGNHSEGFVYEATTGAHR
jgi:hypothetical protein